MSLTKICEKGNASVNKLRHTCIQEFPHGSCQMSKLLSSMKKLMNLFPFLFNKNFVPSFPFPIMGKRLFIPKSFTFSEGKNPKSINKKGGCLVMLAWTK